MFTYSVVEDNRAVSIFRTDSHVTITLEDGTKTELNLVYRDLTLYKCAITSDFGNGFGTCSSVWGPCQSEFGSIQHSFKTTLFIDGLNSGHMVKKEFINGNLSVTYEEAYRRTNF